MPCGGVEYTFPVARVRKESFTANFSSQIFYILFSEQKFPTPVGPSFSLVMGIPDMKSSAWSAGLQPPAEHHQPRPRSKLLHIRGLLIIPSPWGGCQYNSDMLVSFSPVVIFPAPNFGWRRQSLETPSPISDRKKCLSIIHCACKGGNLRGEHAHICSWDACQCSLHMEWYDIVYSRANRTIPPPSLLASFKTWDLVFTGRLISPSYFAELSLALGGDNQHNTVMYGNLKQLCVWKFNPPPVWCQ